MTTHTKSQSKRTTDHETIRRWAEERNGRPATIKSTERGNSPGVLRIEFEDGSGDTQFDELTWNEFFGKFDCANLAMVYQDKTADGKPSRFCKFVNREAGE